MAAALLLPRVAGALLLRPQTYRDVARDESAGIQAGLVVVLVGVSEAAVISSTHGDPVLDSSQILYSVLAALIGWWVWGGILFVVGSRLFDHALDLRAVLRSVAFTHSPSLLYGSAALPGMTEYAGLVLVTTLLWFVASLVACVRGAMDVPASRAVAITGAALVAHEALHQTLRLAGLMG